MNEEGDGPSNRTKSPARHPTSYEAQCEFAIVLDRLNDPEYSMNEEGDSPMPPGTARSDSGGGLARRRMATTTTQLRGRALQQR
jgi:hypothetical protein